MDRFIFTDAALRLQVTTRAHGTTDLWEEVKRVANRQWTGDAYAAMLAAVRPPARLALRRLSRPAPSIYLRPTARRKSKSRSRFACGARTRTRSPWGCVRLCRELRSTVLIRRRGRAQSGMSRRRCSARSRASMAWCARTNDIRPATGNRQRLARQRRMLRLDGVRSRATDDASGYSGWERWLCSHRLCSGNLSLGTQLPLHIEHFGCGGERTC